MWNIVIGIIFIIGSLSGHLVLRGTNSSGALLVVGIGLVIWGVVSVAKNSNKSDEKQTRLTQLQKDPAFAEFARSTHNAWASGALDPINAQYKKEAGVPYEQFVTRSLSPGTMSVLMSQFPPGPGEHLVGIGESESAEPWFILTNLRLIQKDGVSSGFRALDLKDIQSYQFSGSWTKDLVFTLYSGETVRFTKVSLFPAEKYLDFARKLAGAGVLQTA